MIRIFEQNHFGVNTYIVYDKGGECVLIDVASQTEKEKNDIRTFISENNLKPVRLLITHPHIDHICGAAFAASEYNLKLEMHPDAARMIKVSEQSQSNLLGFDCGNFDSVKFSFIYENETVNFGNISLLPLDTGGHCAGSYSYYNKEEGFVVTGDALFAGSIGRTDLPTGDYDLLIHNIETKLLTLPPETIVYPGHGEETTIGFERENNPFI
ncbi:MAG: MBL fold metallo-hydrolase [Bacteroidales bacterium]|jgi:glyoxylase-like metal-dependent hydrolase (beta-lactamase superfamily II)|nr:MBL fold metallo-hydrolase [Bacteroidales bacterium]